MVERMTTRRSFVGNGLRGGLGLAALGGFGALLSACGDDAGSTAPGTGTGTGSAASFGPLTYQLAWIKNAEFAGTYIADDRGYFTEAGFESVELLPGGPSVQPATVIAAGGPQVALASAGGVATANSEGADLQLIGALLQKAPVGFLSLAESPVTDPAQLAGLRVGVPTGGMLGFRAFLALNGLEESDMTVVPVQFDPSPLVNGDVDVIEGFSFVQPVDLEVQGIETTFLYYADFGLNDYNIAYTARRETVESEPELLAAFLGAERRGWQDNIADPEEGTRLTVEVYGSDLGLDPDAQLLSNQRQIELVETDFTRANGLFSMAEEDMQTNLDTLNSVGIDAGPELFTTAILELLE